MSKARELNEKLNPRLFAEMANLSSKVTGLGNQNYIIYISTKQGSHGARVKIYKKGQAGRNKPRTSISIEQDPQVLEDNLNPPKQVLSDVKYWVSINHVKLLELWNADFENVLIDEYIQDFEKVK